MPSGVVPCHVLIIFFLVGRLHCAGFQSLTEQILSLLFTSHSERPFPVRDFFFCHELTSTDFLPCFVAC